MIAPPLAPVLPPWYDVATEHVEGTTAASPCHPTAVVLQLRHRQKRKCSCEATAAAGHEATAAAGREATAAAAREVTGASVLGEATGATISLWASDFLGTAFLRTLMRIETYLSCRA
jgi:hypothetical protein